MLDFRRDMAPPVPRIALCIMAKAPRAGQVKTRLCPPLSPGEAAELSTCFLLDRIAQVRTVSGAEPALAYAPADAAEEFEALAPGLTLLPQRGADLTARLESVLDDLFADGCDAAIMIDSDSPTLPTEFLERAVRLAASGEHDLVLGPSEDGGFYLIGLRRAHPGLFEQMPLSTSAVLAETLRRARARGLRVARLPAWYDVDTGPDLARLLAELGAAPGGARHTRGFVLERLAGRDAGVEGGI